jgi:hypothetical protein
MLKYSGKKGERFFTPTDITNFAFSIPIEIPSTNAFFSEGVNSVNNTVISISGDCIKQDEEVYYNVSETDVAEANKTAPILCAVSNTFFAFTVGENGRGDCKYEINKSWNQFFAEYYPGEIVE